MSSVINSFEEAVGLFAQTFGDVRQSPPEEVRRDVLDLGPSFAADLEDPQDQEPPPPTYDDDNEWFEDEATKYDKVCEVVRQHLGYPTVHLDYLMRVKARMELSHEATARMNRTGALTLLQAQALTMRHRALAQYGRRLERIGGAGNGEGLPDPTNPEVAADSPDHLEALLKVLRFRLDAESMMEDLRLRMPPEWRVVQMTGEQPDGVCRHPRFKSVPFDQGEPGENLAVTLVAVGHGDEELAAVRVPAVRGGETHRTVLKEFHDILAMIRRTYSRENREAAIADPASWDQESYRRNKQDLDSRMAGLLDTMEDQWLGFAKCLLLGLPEDPAFCQRVASKASLIARNFFEGRPQSDRDDFEVSGRMVVLKRCLESTDCLSQDQVEGCARYCFKGPPTEDTASRLEQAIDSMLEFRDEVVAEEQSRKRHPVVFILDKEVQGLPWEAMRCLQGPHPQPVSRVPSLTFLCALIESHNQRRASSVVSTGVRHDRIFYVLNPNGDLAKTQLRLEGHLEGRMGEGLVGEHPTLPLMQKVLTQMDGFIYCTHGSNLKNVPPNEIEKLNIRAVPLLFGCDSGRLSRLGRGLDPYGTASMYLVGMAPCLLGFLWSVTDRDLDSWTVSFLSYWLGDGKDEDESPLEFVRAIANHRGRFQRTINRAAMVVYGLPLVLKKGCQPTGETAPS